MSTSESRKPATSIAKTERFLFETSFDTEPLGGAGAPDAPAEPTFSATDLAHAREAAYAEGEAAGRQDAVNSIEKQLLNGLGRLVEHLGHLSDDQARFQGSVTERSVELALKAIRKMFPVLAQRDGMVEIEALLSDCLQEAKGDPKIVIRVEPAAVEPLRDRIDTLAAKSGHDGTIVLLADDDLGPADCRVEWADGGAERVVEHMWQEFEAATSRIFRDAAEEYVPHPTDEPPAAEPAPETAEAATETFEPVPEPPTVMNGHGDPSPDTAGESTEPAADDMAPAPTPIDDDALESTGQPEPDPSDPPLTAS